MDTGKLAEIQMKGSKLGSLLAGATRIGLDSSIFIYYFEADPRYAVCTKRIFNRVAEGLEAILSAVAVVPASFEIALEAARLRSRYGLKAPDALQLATSLMAGAEIFLTNDGEFRAAAHKEGIKIVLLDDCRE